MARAYHIENLLEGKYYYSQSRKLEGIIQEAEKRSDVYYGAEYEAYTVRVRPTFVRGSMLSNDFWATVAVQTKEI